MGVMDVERQVIMRRFIRGCAFGLFGVSILFGVGTPTLAQKPVEVVKPVFVFPKSVKLEFKGKAGDYYKYLTSERIQGELKAEGLPEEATAEAVKPIFKMGTSVEKSYSLKLLKTEPNRNVNIEIKLIEGVSLEHSAETMNRFQLIPGTILALLKPNLEQLKTTFPPDRKDSVDVKEAKSALSAEPDSDQKQELADLLSSNIYPEHELNIGDTWEFHPQEHHFKDESDSINVHKQFEGTGKLAGFMIFADIPCAKVEIEYHPESITDIFKKKLLAILPKEATYKADMKIRGKSTYLISLDRGAILDYYCNGVLEIVLNAEAEGNSVKISGAFTFFQHETAVKFPAPDSSNPKTQKPGGYKRGE